MREWLELVTDALREIRGQQAALVAHPSGIVFGAASVVSMTSLASAMKTLVYNDLISMGLARSFIAADRGPRSDARGAVALRTRTADQRPDALRALPRRRERPRAQLRRRIRRQRAGRPPPGAASTASTPAISRCGTTDHRRAAAPPLDLANARGAVVGSSWCTIYRERRRWARRLRGRRALPRHRGRPPIEFDIIPPISHSWARRHLRPLYVPHPLQSGRESDQRGARHRGHIRPSSETFYGAWVALLGSRHGGTQDFEIDNRAADVLSDLAMAETSWGVECGHVHDRRGSPDRGGIGLFSVLLISVRERVRRSGSARRSGPNDGAILRLFLAESLTLAFLGAVTGIGRWRGPDRGHRDDRPPIWQALRDSRERPRASSSR